MIGHMIFKKSLDSEDKLGLKVIGGQVLSNGRLAAIVEKVKQGSIADQEGHIKPGMFRPIGDHHEHTQYASQNEFVCAAHISTSPTLPSHLPTHPH